MKKTVAPDEDSISPHSTMELDPLETRAQLQGLHLVGGPTPGAEHPRQPAPPHQAPSRPHRASSMPPNPPPYPAASFSYPQYLATRELAVLAVAASYKALHRIEERPAPATPPPRGHRAASAPPAAGEPLGPRRAPLPRPDGAPPPPKRSEAVRRAVALRAMESPQHVQRVWVLGLEQAMLLDND